MRLPRWHRARTRRDAELHEEMESHLRMAVRDRLERGESPADAHSAARREFGNLGMVQEATRGTWRWYSLERWARELRFALRGLRKSPAFTAAAAATLAIGLAAATIMFGIVNAVLLRPLPYQDANRILTVSQIIPFFAPEPGVVTLREYLSWKASGVLGRCAALDTARFALLGAGSPEQIDGMQVTADFFRLLAVEPILGRDFNAREDSPGTAPVVMLSHRLWARKFHSDPAIVGKAVHLGDNLRTVIGVMPIGFDFPRHADLAGLMSWAPEETEFWIPFQFTQAMVEQGNFNYLVLGRLAEGVPLERAHQRLQAITRHIYEEMAREHSEFGDLIRRNLPGITAHLEPLSATMTKGIRPALWILFGAVALLVMLIYANLANLFLTRNAGRLRELAIRQALGASRRQIFEERVLEGAAFGLLAVALGWLLAVWGTAAVRALGTGHLPRLYELTLDYRAVVLLGLLGGTASLLFGAVPWLFDRRGDFASRLQEHGRTNTGGRGESRLRAWLVTAEIAFSLVLLVGAALLVESFRHVLDADPGFQTGNLLTAYVGLQWNRLPDQPSRYRQFERLLDAVRQQPGVQSAAMTNAVPLTGQVEIHTLRSSSKAAETVALQAELRMVDPDYLRTMHIPLLRGRWFRADDGDKVTVVSGRLARALWADRDPLGRQIRDGDNPSLTVIGVVGEVRNQTLEIEPTLQFYRPAAADIWGGMWFVIRTKAAPENVASEVRRAVAGVDPEQPLAHVRTMREILDATTLSRRFETWLLMSFAAIAVFLTALGVFGVLSLSVIRRTREFGIRMALGASGERILRLILVEASRLVAAGIVGGLALAVFSIRFLRSLLYGVKPGDPAFYFAAVSVIGAAVLVACWIPARRAARADPAAVLREE
jgi:putative ABC transport system permease protein